MDDLVNLDLEFKRYLQLLRPYVCQLLDENVIKICDTWIQRLSDSTENEKALRNQYVFRLCYQLAKGTLEAPFLQKPPSRLQPLSDDFNSDDSSTEVDYLVINSTEPKTKVLFNCKKIMQSDTDYFSHDDDGVSSKDVNHSEKLFTHEEAEPSQMKTLLHYCYPEEVSNKARRNEEEGYACRANNLVKKLREIKLRNITLQRELLALKEEPKCTENFVKDENIDKVDIATSAVPFNIHGIESSSTLKSLKCQLQDIQESRNTLIQTIGHLQDQLDNLNELKSNEIGDIEAKHKLELIKIRTDTREETKHLYEKKFADLRETYEDTVKQTQEKTQSEINAITESKDQIILEKSKLLEIKNKEIDELRHELETQKFNIQSMLTKFIEKSAEDTSGQSLRIKIQLLEKRLNKLERSKIRCTKIYEANISQLQREKHLEECSLQLQLVRQRAQVVSELTDENQVELNTSLDKLENKYKAIVANVQATAIQRRLQDQKALEAILQTVCGIDDNNQTQYPSPTHNLNESFETENITLAGGNNVENVVMGNTVFTEENLLHGFCLNGERMGELLDKIYIPQKDNGDAK